MTYNNKGDLAASDFLAALTSPRVLKRFYNFKGIIPGDAAPTTAEDAARVTPQFSKLPDFVSLLSRVSVRAMLRS